MKLFDKKREIPSGWVGGFAESNPAFAYPNPDLSSLPMLCNMGNINFLTRQQGVRWPEFSWETEPGQTDPKRCYQQFAPYISRLGYDDTGRVYSIICPQQGMWVKQICLNVEVTVTGQRGWVNEDEKENNLAADMSVEAKIWFSPSLAQGSKLKRLWPLLEHSLPNFPLTKEHAIRVPTCLPGNPLEPNFPLVWGETKKFKVPDFARHTDKAWNVGNLEVQILPIRKTGHKVVDGFNELVMVAFNLGSGNMLKPDNILAWNVWFTAPQLVNQEEWKNHAEKWRKSIDVLHHSPTGDGTAARYYDGTPFKPLESAIDEVIHKIESHLKWHLL